MSSSAYAVLVVNKSSLWTVLIRLLIVFALYGCYKYGHHKGMMDMYRYIESMSQQKSSSETPSQLQDNLDSLQKRYDI